MPAISGLIISVVVIRFFSKELWGSVAAMMLWVYFSANICSWGSREFVLREFSRHPEKIFSVWGSSFISRLMLLVIVSAIILITGSNVTHALLLCVCITARFVYQSYEPIVIYRDRFAFITVLEFISLGVFILLLFLLPHINLQQVLLVYALTDLLKAITVAIVFKEFFLHYRSFRIKLQFLLDALPFFLLGLSQLLHARISQFFVNTYLSNSDKAFYQVYTNLLLYVASIPHMAVTPFLKVLFVSDKNIFRKAMVISLTSALAIIPAAVMFIFFMLVCMFHLNVTWHQLLLGSLLILPEFYFALRMYYFYSVNRETTVVVINVVCIVVAGLLGFLLIPGKGIDGALMSAVVSQWLTAILYFVIT